MFPTNGQKTIHFLMKFKQILSGPTSAPFCVFWHPWERSENFISVETGFILRFLVSLGLYRFFSTVFPSWQIFGYLAASWRLRFLLFCFFRGFLSICCTWCTCTIPFFPRPLELHWPFESTRLMSSTFSWLRPWGVPHKWPKNDPFPNEI